MSVFQGKQGKGARRRHRDERYYRAVGRQLLMHDRGHYQTRYTSFGVVVQVIGVPAPVEELLRREHRAAGAENVPIDFRSYATAGAR